MREIMFKGKRKDNGEWVYGDLRHWRNGNVGIHNNLLSYTLTVDPETVGQYTGLTDKNGKRIFEGDIVTCQTKYGADVGQVIFAMGKFCVWWHSEYHYPKNGKMIMCYDINSKTKVIGNIHDNNELLKEDK